MTLNVDRIRKDFPIFDYPDNNNLTYLDNAATTQRPTQVLEEISRYYREYNANTHRGAYRNAEKATLAYEDAREKIARLINARSSREIIFVRGATEAINTAARGWGDRFVRPDDEILITEMEHHSNIVPWQMLVKRRNARLCYWAFDERNGMLEPDGLRIMLSSSTRLLALTHVSNALGTINPVKEIIHAAHARKITVLVDAAQSIPHMPVDVQDLDADMLVFSGHKLYGPTGIGVFYAKEEILNAMDPVQFGGDMIEHVDYFESTWNDLPWKFEGGTPNIAGGIGLGAAVDYVNQIGMEIISGHEKQLVQYALEKLSGVEGVRVYGPMDPDQHGSAVSFTLDRVHPHDLATWLDQHNIAIRSGHHCAQPVMRKLGVPATARISFGVYNTIQEIDRFIIALEQAKEYFSKWL
ncbi:cysteine desulfurase [candidate division KSB1 bacterium]|nr:cysteine desulfurase [candidate division KSB1 bacterium]